MGMGTLRVCLGHTAHNLGKATAVWEAGKSGRGWQLGGDGFFVGEGIHSIGGKQALTLQMHMYSCRRGRQGWNHGWCVFHFGTKISVEKDWREFK